MAYDSGIVSFTVKTNKVDLVDAAHINLVQAELVIIETILGTGVKGDRADLKTRLNNALDADGSLLSGTSFPSPALPSQQFYRTDLDTFNIRNGANTQWNQFGNSLSNVIFSWRGMDESTGTGNGNHGLTLLTTAGTTTNQAGSLYWWANTSNSTNTRINLMPAFKWIKTPGVSTLTFYLRSWNNSLGGSNTIVCDAGGQLTNTDTANSTTPAWLSAITVDVSSLTNGTTYDIKIDAKDTSSAQAIVYLSAVMILGS